MQAVIWQLTQNIHSHPSAEKLVLTHIYSQDWKLYHNIKLISHWSLVIQQFQIQILTRGTVELEDEGVSL
jgi:cytochrome b involved in lipid metabolism